MLIFDLVERKKLEISLIKSSERINYLPELTTGQWSLTAMSKTGSRSSIYTIKFYSQSPLGPTSGWGVVPVSEIGAALGCQSGRLYRGNDG